MRELLFSITKDDFEFQVFRAGGKGGQKQNKTSSGVRLIHKKSGAIGESRSERSQSQNKKLAFKRLIDSNVFQIWLKKEISIISDGYDKVQQKIDKDMDSSNLKIEYKKDGKWVELKI